jgi:hypothetical protein
VTAVRRPSLPLSIGMALVFAISFASSSVAVARAACPFCESVQPTFAERRAEAQALLIGEVADATPDTKPSGKSPPRTFTVRQTIDGKDLVGQLDTVTCDAPDAKPGGLALLLGTRADAAAPWRWDAIMVEEAALGYFLRAPGVKQSAVERLPYFSKYLEHADRQVADDAFWEFGRAPFDAVAAVEATLPYEKLRRALVDVNVPGNRKGFYGLALGMAKDPMEQAANRSVLAELVGAPATDFRAGFDGILAGYLLVEGVAGLDTIDARFLANPKAAEGDVRHAQAALRFYLQYGRAIPAERLLKSVALLLDRPATAPLALSDLTRRQAWSYTARVVGLFTASPGDDPALDRAVVGYLLVCPKPEAREALRKLKADYAERTKAALDHWMSLGLGERS